MKKNERIILWRDEAQIKDMQERLEGLLPLAQEVVKAYFALPFANPDIDFHSIYANTEEQAKEYIRVNTPNNLNVAGLTLNKSKFAQFLELDGMYAFYESKEAFRANQGDGLVRFFRLERKSHINDETSLVINSTEFEKYADRYTIAARTEEDRKLYDIWQKWVETTQEFSDYMRKHADLIVLSVNGAQIPNASAFLRLDNEKRIKINHVTFQAAQKNLG